jgi:toxin ParE1/3/4
MVRLIWSNLSIKELKDIHNYIAQDSKFYAKREVFKIRKKVNILKSNPNLGKNVFETGSNYKEIIEGNYRIIYEVVNLNKLSILSIHHSSRSLKDRIF